MHIDLTHTIFADMPVYPGTEETEIIQAFSLGKDGFMEKRITMYSHTGTHLDAPAHLLSHGKTLDLFPLSAFTGTATVVDVSRVGRPEITTDYLTQFHSTLQQAEFVLLHTGWSALWGKKEYFSGFPTLTPEAARWLAGLSLKGFGMDTISVDQVNAEGLPVHMAFLERDILIIENLANLASLAGKHFFFSCYPLKLEQSDGSPVRAVATLP